MKLIGLFDLVDEVLDAGDALIVRNGDREERILFADIVDVVALEKAIAPAANTIVEINDLWIIGIGMQSRRESLQRWGNLDLLFLIAVSASGAST